MTTNPPPVPAQPSEESLKAAEEIHRDFLPEWFYALPEKKSIYSQLLDDANEQRRQIATNIDHHFAEVRAQAAMAGELAAQLRELLPFARLALDVEPVGGPDEPCSVNMGNAQIEFSESLLARFSATKSTKEAT